MHAAVEKSNLAENGGVKMSKRKSKNHRKHQKQLSIGQDKSSEPDDSTVSTTNGTSHDDPLKSFSEKLDEYLHIRENGCTTEKDQVTENGCTTENDQVTKNGELAAKSLRTDSCKSTKSSTPKTRNCRKNGDVEHNEQKAAKEHSNTNNNNNESLSPNEQREPSNTNETHPTVNGVHSSHQSSSSSSSSTEQISNKNECQGLELEKNVSPVSLAVSEPIVPAVEDDSENVESIVIEYKEYESELQMQDIMRLIQTELSEPYSIYTYRYFIYNWPKLCFLAAHGKEYVGAIVCKLDMHMNVKRGYIAMLAVKKEYRKMKIGTNLVQKAIEAMLADDADEVVLETEMKNLPALRLYENLGFVRDKRLFRYYLNGVDALRLKLWFR